MTDERSWPEVNLSLKAAWTLDPTVHYLNHGAFGACPRIVLEYQNELRSRLEREPTQFMRRYLGPALDAARESLAGFVGASADDIVFADNATSGVNVVLHNLQLQPGDDIVTTSHDYAACRVALRAAAERAQARLIVADVPYPIANADIVVERVLAAVTERTKLVLIDHITSPTGIVFPVERVVTELRERGVDVLVDGAHATGMIDLDVDAIGAAYYVGNLHKWLCTPKSTAFVHVRRDRQERFLPLVMNRGREDGHSALHRAHDWPGTRDMTAFLCIPRAIATLGTMLPGGWSDLRLRNRATALAARRLLCSRLGVEAPAPEDMIATLVTLPVPRGPENLQDRLFDEHNIEVPVFQWGERRWFRVCAQLYNGRDDYEALATALATF